jgi:phage terminase small subunit
MGMGLTIKQERFAQKYIELGNASEAYRQSYDAENMAPETVHNEAHILLKNPEVSARVERLEELRLKRHAVTADRVIVEMAKIAFSDIRKAFDDEGNFKPIHELDDETAAAVAGIEVDELFEGFGKDREQVGNTRKIKIADKKAALDSLFKHLGLFTDKLELTGKDGKPIEISDAKAALLRGLVPDATSGGTDQANK